jgi:hypothetical protein
VSWGGGSGPGCSWWIARTGTLKRLVFAGVGRGRAAAFAARQPAPHRREARCRSHAGRSPLPSRCLPPPPPPPLAQADAPRLGREESVTVSKAALDLSQFCGAEPLGPKQLVLQLRCVYPPLCCGETRVCECVDEGRLKGKGRGAG